MKVRVAYLDEPPFYSTAPDGSVVGSDIELAEVVLHAAGFTSIEYELTSFDELLPGVLEGRWDMNVPLFLTPQRAEVVAFSVPVWAIGDGFLTRRGNPLALTSYAAVAANGAARLGVVAQTVQRTYAKQAGADDARITEFKDQADAVDALARGVIDAYASTGIGSRALAAQNDAFEAIALGATPGVKVPVGAFSLRKDNQTLLQAVNEQLHRYLGSTDHRLRMARHGFTDAEIDGALGGR